MAFPRSHIGIPGSHIEKPICITQLFVPTASNQMAGLIIWRFVFALFVDFDLIMLAYTPSGFRIINR